MIAGTSVLPPSSQLKLVFNRDEDDCRRQVPNWNHHKSMLTSLAGVAPFCNKYALYVPPKSSSLGSPGDGAFGYLQAFVTFDGKRYPSIVIGGEPRVPYQMFVNFYENEYTRDVIDVTADELQIAQKVATPDQVRVLLDQDPTMADMVKSKTNLTLVSNTDMERILGRLYKGTKQEDEIMEDDQIEVMHCLYDEEELHGILVPSRPEPQNICCKVCQNWFAPSEFVLHSHAENLENSSSTVHWGLCGEKWRFMIHLPADSSEASKTAYAEFVMRGIENEDERRFIANSLKRPAFDDLDDDCLRHAPKKVALPPLELKAKKPKMINYPENASNDVNLTQEEWQEIYEKELRFKRKVLEEARRGEIPGIDPAGTEEEMQQQAARILNQIKEVPMCPLAEIRPKVLPQEEPCSSKSMFETKSKVIDFGKTPIHPMNPFLLQPSLFLPTSDLQTIMAQNLFFNQQMEFAKMASQLKLGELPLPNLPPMPFDSSSFFPQKNPMPMKAMAPTTMLPPLCGPMSSESLMALLNLNTSATLANS